MELKCSLGQQIFLPSPRKQSVGGSEMWGRGGNPPFPLPLCNGTSFRHIIVPPLHPPIMG